MSMKKSLQQPSQGILLHNSLSTKQTKAVSPFLSHRLQKRLLAPAFSPLCSESMSPTY